MRGTGPDVIHDIEVPPGQTLEDVGLSRADVDGMRLGPMTRTATLEEVARLSRSPGQRYQWDGVLRYLKLRRLVISCRANRLDIPAWLQDAEEVWDLLDPDEMREVNADRERVGLQPRPMKGLTTT